MIGWLIVAVVFLGVFVFMFCKIKHFQQKHGEDWVFETRGVILVILAGLAVLFFVLDACFAISAPIEAKQEYLEFENTRIIVQQAYESGTASDNLSITNTVISANKWLAQAKANKQVYGIFSKYYFIDFEKIEPIELQRSEEQCQEIFQKR